MRTVTAPLDYAVSSYAEATADGTSRTLDRVRHTLHVWRERSKGRHALAALTPRMLEDVGIDPGDAMKEVAKPFWRA